MEPDEHIEYCNGDPPVHAASCACWTRKLEERIKALEERLDHLEGRDLLIAPDR